MSKYIAVMSFVMEIDADDERAARSIGELALPHWFHCTTPDGGSGKYLKSIVPIVYASSTDSKLEVANIERQRRIGTGFERCVGLS